MTCSSSIIHGGYKYSTKKRSTGKGYRRVKKNKSKKYMQQRRRINSVGLSLARGRTFSGGNSGFPNGYSTGGILNPMLNSLATPPIIHPYNTCI